MVVSEGLRDSAETIRRELRSGRWSGEFDVQRKNGSFLPVSGVATPVLDEGGDLVGTIGVAMDASERKGAEGRLRRAEARYRTLVERIPAVTYVKEIGDYPRTLYVSPQIEWLLDYPQKEWLGSPDHWKRCIHPEDRERVLAEDAHSDATGEPFRSEYRMLRRDGGIFWVHDEAVLTEDPRGRSHFWQGVMMDITERMTPEGGLHI